MQSWGLLQIVVTTTVDRDSDLKLERTTPALDPELKSCSSLPHLAPRRAPTGRVAKKQPSIRKLVGPPCNYRANRTDHFAPRYEQMLMSRTVLAISASQDRHRQVRQIDLQTFNCVDGLASQNPGKPLRLLQNKDRMDPGAPVASHKCPDLPPARALSNISSLE